jgi:hypothetical protein
LISSGLPTIHPQSVFTIGGPIKNPSHCVLVPQRRHGINLGPLAVPEPKQTKPKRIAEELAATGDQEIITNQITGLNLDPASITSSSSRLFVAFRITGEAAHKKTRDRLQYAPFGCELQTPSKSPVTTPTEFREYDDLPVG